MVNRAFLALVVLTTCLACAGGDYQIALPRGYFIARVKPGDFALIEPDGRAVAVRTVKAYMVHEQLVIGQTAPSPEGEPLYFIVNTQTNSVRTNLPASRWRDELRRFGVRSTVLEEPKPTHALRRWFSR